ncbi:MAG TPA: ABC transporter permease [Planctomycetota bacterium]|nr:ABC transporter permease [Planctomycetota bacterium]
MSPLTDALRLPFVVVRYRELLSAFVRRDLKARFEGSILGRIWPVLQPAILFAIYYVIFAKLMQQRFADTMPPHGEEGTGWRSTFFLITGILPWTALAESLARGTGVVLENANLIKKIAFPSELLAIYQVIVYHVYFLVGFVILLGLELAVNGGLPAALVWFPAVLLVQMMFISGLAMLLSAANVFVRDIMQAVPMLLTFWMLTTPVFYDLNTIQAAAALGGKPGDVDWAGMAGTAMHYNPMAILLGIYRAMFSFGAVEFPLVGLIKLALVAAITLWLGYAYFLRSKGRFADEV